MRGMSRFVDVHFHGELPADPIFVFFRVLGKSPDIQVAGVQNPKKSMTVVPACGGCTSTIPTSPSSPYLLLKKQEVPGMSEQQ